MSRVSKSHRFKVFHFDTLTLPYGEVAQLVRACGSYPQCRRFESAPRYFRMRKIVVSLLLIFSGNAILSGCAVHRLEKSKELDGYAVARFGYVIPEYTVDLNNKAPEDFSLALDRYKRRKDTVEIYYLKMNQIESYFRRYVGHFPMIIWSVFANFWKMPFHIVSEYRYEHDEQYRKMIDDLDNGQKVKEDQRIAKLKNELNEFIKQDLEKEK